MAIKKYRSLISQLVKFRKSEGRQFNLASLYLNLGNSYKENLEFKKAKSYFHDALKLFKQLHKGPRDCRKQIAWSYGNIGHLYLMQRDFPKSLKFNLASMKIRETLFKEDPEKYKIEYVMSLFNKSISLQQLSQREEFISSLKHFIKTYDDLDVKDAKAYKFYEDAKGRLAFATNEDLNKLKSLEDIKVDLPKFIQKHKGYEPTPEQVENLIQEFRDICGGSIIKSVIREGLEQFYFRVRSKSSMNNRDILDPNQFKYPPSKFTGFGRVNLSKHPVFYGGEKISVVVKETHIKEGELFYLSCWRSNDFYPKYALMHSNITNSNRMTNLQKSYKERMADSMKSLPNLLAEKFEYIFETLSELFTIDDWTISSAIGFDLLYCNDSIDGIEYPDVKTRSSFNFALKPEAADKLSLMRVYLCRLSEGEVEFIETGNINNEIISYTEYKKEHHPLEQEGVRVIKEEKKYAR